MGGCGILAVGISPHVIPLHIVLDDACREEDETKCDACFWNNAALQITDYGILQCTSLTCICTSSP